MTATRCPARTGEPGHHMNFADGSRTRRAHGDFHLHRLDDEQHVAGLYRVAGTHAHLPEVARDLAVHRDLAVLQRREFRVLRRPVRRSSLRPRPLRANVRVRPGTRLAAARGIARCRRLRARETLDSRPATARSPRSSADIGRAESPRGCAAVRRPRLRRSGSGRRSAAATAARAKSAIVAIAIPHLQRAADKLIAARPFHAVHAQIRAADAHRVLRPSRCAPGCIWS